MHRFRIGSDRIAFPYRSKIGPAFAIAMLTIVLGGCATPVAPKPPVRPELQAAMDTMSREGLALVVDGCVERKTVAGASDYFGAEESHRLALMVQKGLRTSMMANRVALRGYSEPYVCGIVTAVDDRHARLAPRFDATFRDIELPEARFPTTRPELPRGAALLQLMAQAAAPTEPRPNTDVAPMADADARLLRAQLGARYVLVGASGGRSKSDAAAVQAVVIDVLTVLAEPAGHRDDTSVRLALIDLQTGRSIWANRSLVYPHGNGIDPTTDFAAQADARIDELIAPLWTGTDPSTNWFAASGHGGFSGAGIAPNLGNFNMGMGGMGGMGGGFHL